MSKTTETETVKEVKVKKVISKTLHYTKRSIICVVFHKDEIKQYEDLLDFSIDDVSIYDFKNLLNDYNKITNHVREKTERKSLKTENELLKEMMMENTNMTEKEIDDKLKEQTDLKKQEQENETKEE